jgi:NAD(P)-dependent dehydrogenase (short-subunit alcohol dehydrogenase family)
MVEYATYPSLRGKTVLITGGAEGIGSAAVELFCRQGSQVIFLDYADESAAKVVERIKAIPGATQPVFMHCDLVQLDEVKACIEKTLALQGSVDVLINNAGGTGKASRVPTTQVTPETFDHDINVNLRHQFFLTQYVVPAMQKQGSGSIINLGSIMWCIPETTAPVYATAKAAVVGMTKIHSKEYGPSGVRVNSISMYTSELFSVLPRQWCGYTGRIHLVCVYLHKRPWDVGPRDTQ